MAISEAAICSVFMVVTAAAASEQVEVHRLFGRREARVIQQGAECAVILDSDRFGGDEVEVAFADLALGEQVLEAGESKVVFCWMRTNTWREMLDAEIWVIMKRVSMRLAKDKGEMEIPAPTNLSAFVFSNGSRQFERKYAPDDEYNGDGD